MDTRRVGTITPVTGAPRDDSWDDPLRAVAHWRAQSAAPVDPVIAAIVDGLARRAAAQSGALRDQLVGRLRQWLDKGTPTALPQAAGTEPNTTGITPAPCIAGSVAALAALVDRLGRSGSSDLPTSALDVVPAPGAKRRREPPADDRSRVTGPARKRSAAAAPPRAGVELTPAPLKAVAAYRGTWSRLRAQQRLQQALAQVPAQAGPLHSSHVVYRALQEIQALSPAYLDAFLTWADTLLALEQASGTADWSPARPAAKADGDRRAGSRTSRKG